MDYNGLVCCESLSENKAYKDPTLLDVEVFLNLLKQEDRSTVICKDIQTDVTVAMRKIVIGWMKEVTEEQRCQLEVFLLAVNYMNRVLNTFDIKRNNLQLLATACMLIASKLRESSPLTAELLKFYTDNSITLCQLLTMEQIVLNKLKWDISVVTPLDFLQHILFRIPTEPVKVKTSQVEQEAKALISCCACEKVFWGYPPSLIAASCIVSVLFSLRLNDTNPYGLQILTDKICEMTNTETENLQIYVKQIEDIILKGGSALTREPDNYQTNNCRRDEYSTPPLPDKTVEMEAATTPTDIHNIDF